MLKSILIYIIFIINITYIITSPPQMNLGLSIQGLSIYTYLTFPLSKKETLNTEVIDRIIHFCKNE